ncbi:hypothetical protein ACNKHR_15100 [Shigella flexneri]
MQENYKILVVDDDMRLRALLERYLTNNFQVRSVAECGSRWIASELVNLSVFWYWI